MKPLILIYETDAWHSSRSRNLIAIATTERQRDILAGRFLRTYLMQKPKRDTYETAMNQLRTMGQTQCLNEECDIELDTELVWPNVIQY